MTEGNKRFFLTRTGGITRDSGRRVYDAEGREFMLRTDDSGVTTAIAMDRLTEVFDEKPATPVYPDSSPEARRQAQAEGRPYSRGTTARIVDLATVSTATPQHLTITLSGPQGSGKTRMAAHLASWLNGKGAVVLGVDAPRSFAPPPDDLLEGRTVTIIDREA